MNTSNDKINFKDLDMKCFIFDLIEYEDCEKSGQEMKNQHNLHTNIYPHRKKIIVYI